VRTTSNKHPTLPRPHWRWIRRQHDLAAILDDRCGRHLPDDDSGRDYLQLLLNHLVRTSQGRMYARSHAFLWAPWCRPELNAMIETAVETSQHPPISAAMLGKALRLTAEERERLGITQIAAFDSGAIRVRQFRSAHSSGRKRGRPTLQISPEEKRTRRLAQEAERKRVARASAKNAKRASHSIGMRVTDLMRTRPILAQTIAPMSTIDLDGIDFTRFGIVAMRIMSGNNVIREWRTG